MKPEVILHSDLLDILFENRNKSYGAYALRKEYPKQLGRALGMVLLLLVVLCLIQSIEKNKRGLAVDKFSKKDSGIVLKTVDLVVPEHFSPVKPPIQKTISNVTPTIVTDKNANNRMPEIKELSNAVIGTQTIDGPPAETTNIPVLPNPASGGSGVKEGNEKAQPEISDWAEVQPEFPGGTEGWIRFLKKNLRPKESDESYKVTVIVRFVVNEDGSLSELQITKGGGSEFDNEVLRVMKKSPKWIAGSNHGHKVKVYHSQPVIFINQADE
jgi:protein TonB